MNSLRLNGGKTLANLARSAAEHVDRNLPSVKYKCERCEDSGVYRDENGYSRACPCQKANMNAIYLKYANIPDFPEYPLIPIAQDYVDHFDSILKSGKNWLGFFGKSGSGKSTQAFEVAKALILRKNPVRCRCFWYPDVLHELSTRRFDTEEYDSKLEQFLDAELVVIDDFLDVIPRPDTFEEQVALTLIKRRYAQRKPLIFTTEARSRYIYEKMKSHADALIGRIVEMCAGRCSVADENAPNYRLEKMI